MAKGLWITLGIILVVVIVGIVFLVNSGYKAPMSTNTNTGGSSSTNNGNTNTGTGTTAKTEDVDISGFAFNPSTITVKVGDTVRWTNNQASVQHTVTSDSGSELGSAPLSTGQTYSHTFENAGTYNYHCSIHTMMKGTVVVQ